MRRSIFNRYIVCLLCGFAGGLVGVFFGLGFVIADLSLGAPIFLNILTFLMVVLTSIVAFYTAQSAQAARLAAEETGKGVKAQLLWGLLNSYSKEDMQEALSYLANWYNGKSNLGQELKGLQATSIWKDRKLAVSRRRVSHYFQQVYYLWQKVRLLDDEYANLLVDKIRAGHYLTFVEPLEYARRADYQGESFEFYEKEYELKPREIPGLPNWYRRSPSYKEQHWQ